MGDHAHKAQSRHSVTADVPLISQASLCVSSLATSFSSSMDMFCDPGQSFCSIFGTSVSPSQNRAPGPWPEW